MVRSGTLRGGSVVFIIFCKQSQTCFIKIDFPGRLRSVSTSGLEVYPLQA